MLTLSPMTELDSVNIMLSTIGESPVSSLTASESTVDVSIARQVLREITIQVQATGWHFNTEKEWMMPIDVNGNIAIPANCVQIDSSGKDTYLDVAMRGGLLYNRTAHTSVFTDSVCVDMIILLDFTDLPQAARNYIAIRAARVFQQRMVGSDSLNSLTEKDEMRAKAALKKLDSNNADYNILSGSWSVARSLTR